MSAPVLALLLATAVTGTASPSAGPAAPAAVASSLGPDRGTVGVSLMAAGAGLATGSVVVLTLIEALTTPDRERQAVSSAQETLVSVGGAASAAIAGLSAVAIVVGGGLAISAALEGTPASTPTE